jgi:hypothetical protein
MEKVIRESVANIEFGYPGGGYVGGKPLQAKAQRGNQNCSEKPIRPAE